MSETPFAIISACIPCSMHLFKKITERVRHLLANGALLLGLATSAPSGNPKAYSAGQQRRSKPHNNDGFVQLDSIAIATPTSRLGAEWRANSILHEAYSERKENACNSLRPSLSPDVTLITPKMLMDKVPVGCPSSFVQ